MSVNVACGYLSGVADLSHDRGHVDNAAPAGPQHDASGRLGGVEDTRQVDVDDGLPGFGLHRHDQA